MRLIAVIKVYAPPHISNEFLQFSGCMLSIEEWCFWNPVKTNINVHFLLITVWMYKSRIVR